tara:strand:- start:1243 stop:1800 length:558 start_codon:yes stop_codon:yes gene_type:complete
MANEPADTNVDEAEDGAEAAAKKKPGLVKLGLFIGLPVIILALGATAALMMFTGGDDEAAVVELDEHGEPIAPADSGRHAAVEEEVFFYEIPQMQVTIQNGSGGFAHLQISFNLEITDEHLSAELDHELPRIIDQFQGFLREMRPEDLAGSAGGYRLRLELLRRVNLVLGEDKVRAVLIDQFVVA